MRIIIPLMTAAFLSYQDRVAAQAVITHPETGNGAPVELAAGAYFYYDSGGPDGSYADNEDGTLTLCPSQSNEVIRVLFEEADLEIDPNDNDCVDVLEISGDAKNRNGDYCGNPQQSPGAPFFNLVPGANFESEPGQCMTFSFTSDPASAGDGWKARVDVRAPAACTGDLECGQLLMCENFESLAPWGIAGQTEQWIIKSEEEAVDGMVTRETSSEGDQSLRIETINNKITDIALLLGNRTQGRYRLSWKIFVPNGSQGRYNFQHRQALNHWAFQVKFSGGSGSLFIPNDQAAAAASFNYQPGQWVDFVHILDLDADQAQLWVGGQFVHQWQFSLGDDQAGNQDVLNQLGAVNFSSSAIYYLDEIYLTEVGCPDDQCEDIDPCAVTVNNQQFVSRCEACCAGYTSKEWQEENDLPEITAYSDLREWVDQGQDISLMDFGDGPILFIDSRAIDTVDFRETDIVLSNYCPAGLRVEVEDTRPAMPEDPCYRFDVIWRVFVGEDQVDADTLPVVSECKQIASIDTIIYLPTMDTLLAGDTLRLSHCPMPDSSQFHFILDSCPGGVNIRIRREGFTWIEDVPQGQRNDDTPCFREDYQFRPSQCDIPGPVFNISVEIFDNERPELIPPPDTSIACLKELDDPVRTGTALLSVMDSCGIRDTMYVDDLTQMGDDCSGIVRRTWTVIDSCGNRRSAVQRLFVQDTMPPSFEAPDPITIDGMDMLGDLTVTGQVSEVTDNCQVRDTSYVDDFSGLTECVGQVIRTWTVTDNCGNAHSLEQVIFVRDTEPPTMAVPADIAVDCLEDLEDQQITGTITGVSDNIGVADTSFMEDLSGLQDCRGIVRRTWTVTDSCGNQTTGTQTISIRDTIAPTFVAPFQVTISCVEELSDLSVTGSVLFVNDNCGIRDTIYRDSIVQASDCIFSVWRTWTVTDNCGNSVSKVQRIQLADTEPPEFEVPVTETVSLSQVNDLSITGMITNVTDNCSIRDTSFSDVLVREGTCQEEGWIIRTWEVTDGCGNTSRLSQDIFFLLDRPVADAGQDTLISCQEPLTQLGGPETSTGSRYIYSWRTTEGNIISGFGTRSPIVNAPGNYRLEVRDTVNGCRAFDEVSVRQENDLEPNMVSKTDLTCTGDSTGVIVIDPKGGVAPYTVLWSTGDTTNLIDSLTAGQYAVTVSDNGSCQTVSSFIIEQPDSLMISFSNLESSSCLESTGGATARITGGTAPYRLLWDNGEEARTATMLSVGQHTLMVQDSNGCSALDTIIIGKDIPEINIAPLPEVCENAAPLPLFGATPAGGQYVGAGVQNGLFDPRVVGVGRHEIGYAIAAGNGCTDTATTFIRVNALTQLTDTGYDPVCENAGEVVLDFILPTGGFYSGPGISTDTLRPGLIGTGTYPILYTYRDPQTGCSNSLASLITVEPVAAVSFDIEVSDTVFCESQELEVTALVSNGGAEPDFEWEIPGIGMLTDTSASFSIRLPAGTYQLKGSMISSLACVDFPTLTDSIGLTVTPVTLTVTSPPGDTICSDVDTYLLTGGAPAGGIYRGDFLEGDSMFLPSKAGPGVYSLSYVVTDTVTGCPAEASFLLTVEICTGTDPVLGAFSLNVFPNPAREFIDVTFEGEQIERGWLELWDSQGRNLRKRPLQPASGSWTERLEILDLPPGIYFLGLRVSDRVLWRKVIIQQ